MKVTLPDFPPLSKLPGFFKGEGLAESKISFLISFDLFTFPKYPVLGAILHALMFVRWFWATWKYEDVQVYGWLLILVGVSILMSYRSLSMTPETEEERRPSWMRYFPLLWSFEVLIELLSGRHESRHGIIHVILFFLYGSSPIGFGLILALKVYFAFFYADPKET